MRIPISVLVVAVLVWSCVGSAQTRKDDDSSDSHSSRSRSGSSTPAATSTPSAPAQSRGFSTTSSPSGGRVTETSGAPQRRTVSEPVTLTPARPTGLSRDHRHHYPYDYPWDYERPFNRGDSYAGQNQTEYRSVQDRSDDERRQRELERLIADQHAADVAEAALRDKRTLPAKVIERDVLLTVLIYKDHRQTEIGNYAVGGNFIYEFGFGSVRKIAISDLDIPATMAANKERGVEFNLPYYSRLRPIQE